MKTGLLTFGLLIFTISLNAHSAVIDFELLETSGVGLTDIENSYSEDGYTLAVDANADDTYLSYWHTGNANYAGSTALFNSEPNEVTTLTSDNGLAFDLLSIDLSEISNGTGQSTVVTFDGVFMGGGAISQNITLDGLFGFETLIFSGFTGLASVSWLQVTDFHQFDNITVSSVSEVPIPAAALMFAPALLGFLGLRRRAKNNAA